MLTIEKSPEHVLSLKLSGTVEKSDIQKMEKEFSRKMQANDRMGLLVDMTEWSDMTGDALAEDMKFELGLLGKLNCFPKMAIVSNKQFVKAILSFLDPLLPMVKVGYFTPDRYDEAVAFASELPAVKSAA